MVNVELWGLVNSLTEKINRNIFDLSNKDFKGKEKLSVIDTEIGEKNIKSNKRIELYENDLRAIKILNDLQEKLKNISYNTYIFDFDLIVDRRNKDTPIYYICGKKLNEKMILLF